MSPLAWLYSSKSVIATIIAKYLNCQQQTNQLLGGKLIAPDPIHFKMGSN